MAKKIKLLIVDDRVDNLLIIESLVKEYFTNVEIFKANNAADGIKIATEKQVDGALVDVQMPKMDGIEMCRRLKADESTSHISIILITSHRTTPELRARGLEAGADDFIHRPFDNQEFVARVKVMIRVKRAEDELREMNEHLEELVTKRTGELQESEAKFRNFMESSTEGFAILDYELSFLECNEAGAKILGLKTSDIVGKNAVEISPDLKESGRYDEYLKVISTGNKLHFEDLIPHPSLGNVHLDLEAFKVGDGLGIIITDVTERKRAEEALRESQSMLKNITDNMFDLVSTADLNGKFLYVSPSYKTVLGYEQEELIGRDITELVHSEDLTFVLEKLAEGLSTQMPQVAEYRCKTTAGRCVWLETMGKVYLDDQGDPTGMIFSSRNITERLHAEQALRKSETRFRDISESMAEWIWETDAQGITTFVSGQASSILGYSAEEILGKTAFDFMSTEEAQRVAGIFSEIIKKKSRIRDLENWNLTKDGRSICMLTNGIPLLDEDGELIGYRGVNRDITERKLAEEALNDLKVYLANIIHAIPDPVFVKDEQFKFMLVNEALCTLLGKTHDELIGNTGMEFLPKDQMDHFLEVDRMVLSSGEVTLNEEPITDGDGKIRTIVTKKSRYIDRQGAKFIVGVIRDITDRKKADEALIESEKQYRLLAENSKDAIWLMELDGRFSYVSPYVEQMTGFSPEEVIDLSPEEFLTSESVAEIGKLLAEQLALPLQNREDSVFMEQRQYRKDGSELDIEISASWILDEEGNPIAVQGVSRDITERKRAEEALRESEERIRTILETAMSGFWLADTQGRLLEVNEAYCQMSGYSTQELLSMTISDLEVTETAEDVAAHIQKVITQGEDRFESRHRRKDGSLFDVESSVQFQSFDHGRLVVFLDDITKRKRATAALKASEDQYRSLVETIPYGIQESDLSGIITFSSTGHQKILGFGKEEIEGKSIWDFMAGSDAQKEEQRKFLNHLVREQLSPQPVFSRNLRRDGKEIHLQIDWNYRRDANGILIGFTSIITDITERKRAEAEEKRQTELFAAMFDNMPVMITVYNPSVQVLTANKTFIDTVGWTNEDLKRIDLLKEVYPDPEYRKGAVEFMEKASDEWKEFIVRTKDGRDLESTWTNVVLSDDTRIGIGLDISKEKLAEKEKGKLEDHLRQQQKLESIGTLASGVAHEINNPITSILNFAELIQMKTKGNEQLADFTQRIINDTNRVAKIVKNLLAFARQGKESHSSAFLADIINDTLSLIAAVLHKDQIVVAVDVPDDLPKIKCRTRQIQQVLMNLLTNARDALNERYPESDENKTVRITCVPLEKEGEKWIRTTVKNHGGAIPPEIMDRIFDPFFTTKPRDVGTGLGLSISYGIVSEHKGKLSVESDENSTSFHMDLRVNNGWTLEKPDSTN
jgi:PAS domain S-box-containing protein